jgi:hypothetical protein
MMRVILFLILNLAVLSTTVIAQKHWEPFPAHFNGYTQSLYVDSAANELYVLGDFNEVDSKPRI